MLVTGCTTAKNLSNDIKTNVYTLAWHVTTIIYCTCVVIKYTFFNLKVKLSLHAIQLCALIYILFNAILGHHIFVQIVQKIATKYIVGNSSKSKISEA